MPKFWCGGVIGAEQLPVALPFGEIDLNERNRAIRMVQDIRPKLAKEFKSVSDEDLAVQEIVLISNRAKQSFR